MTIPAQRFSSLTSDFNVGSQSFQSLKDNEILNAPLNSFEDAMNSAKDLISQLKELEQDVLNPAKDLIQEATRVAQDFVSSFTDMAKLPESAIEGFLNDLFPGSMSGASNAFKNISKLCRNKALGSAAAFGKVPIPKCDGMNVGFGNCSPSQAANALGRAGINGMNSILDKARNALAAVLSLANAGYNANLCGVFAAVTDGITSIPLLTSSAGILANQQGGQGNLSAIFDIVKGVAGNGLNVAGVFPGTVEAIAKGVTSLGQNYQNDANTMGDSFLSSLEAIDQDWGGSLDGITSVAKVAASSVLPTIGSNLLKNKTFDPDDLGQIVGLSNTSEKVSAGLKSLGSSFSSLFG